MLEKKAELIEIKKSICERTRFSIAVPTYKRPETLKNTIKSVLSQKYIEDYTVIILDNNPERGDDTELFVEGISDNRVSYYKNSTNVGMVNNWNQCIIAADSEWVVFVHDDDLLTEDCLKIIDDTIAANPNADAILPNFIQVGNPYSKQETIKLTRFRKIIKTIIRAIIPRDEPIAANLFCDNIYGPPTCGLALRRKAFIDSGGYSDRCIAADWDFMSQFSRTHKIAKCRKQTGTYLWAVNASMKESTMEQIRKDRILVLNNIIEHSSVCRFYYKLLRKDFDKKFASKTTEHVEYSLLYKLMKRYYSLRI